ncbi:lantibiotic dehydratase C-terminal domain-containing protein [Amycolatopsis sp. CA-128772]|uniref:lantibiotic dehydratase C-terminal domain-containing protein n=1 Tax=Amycolatopsis sp. CA-128772 TaxID=2073159 RepID=UPI0011B09B41|nr:lantibiotic dehydratase C-terminal domain-containing protein [Amycolatopsis sp. CA-128772]
MVVESSGESATVLMCPSCSAEHPAASLSETQRVSSCAAAGPWRARAAALADYRTRLGADADLDAVLESLLHMHHNRAAGIDRDGENTCRRLARHAAFAWNAQHQGTRT